MLSEDQIRPSDIVIKFKTELDHHYSNLVNGKVKKVFRVPDYAKAQQLHPNYLNNLIKNATGKAIGRWIIEKNIHTAKHLLSSTDYSIKEIANILKFADLAHFSNYFKKYTSYSPSYYRYHNR